MMYKTSLELVVKLSDADRERAMRDDDNNNNDTIGSVRHRVSHRCDQQMAREIIAASTICLPHVTLFWSQDVLPEALPACEALF